MKGHFAKSLQELKKDFAKYDHFCKNVCKGETPINNTTCTKCRLYQERKVEK